MRIWLTIAVLILLLGSWGGIQLVNARQDPTLQAPGAGPDDLDVPSAPLLPTE